MYVPHLGNVSGFDVFGFEFHPCLVGVRNDEEVQTQGQCGNECGCGQVWHHHPVETDSTTQNCDNLRVRRHLRSEENHCYEHEQRREHIDEIRYEIHIIVKDYLLQWGFLGHEIVDFLADVENDHYPDNQKQGNEEGEYELLEYVEVQFPGSEVEFHPVQLKILSSLKSGHQFLDCHLFPI